MEVETGEGQEAAEASKSEGKASKTEEATKKTEEAAKISKDTQPKKEFSAAESANKALAIPSVRHLSKKHNIDINQVEGTGKDGRVTKGDVLQFMKEEPSKKPSQ